jgi:hypothetical protein
MFEEQIAHGNDMIRRLEPEISLSYWERDQRPAYQRLPMKEWNTWIDAVGQRIRVNFGPDTIARYDLIWQLFKDEVSLISKGQSDEALCALNALRRVVALLSELDKRLETKSLPLGASSQPEATTSKALGPEIELTRYDVFISHAYEDKEKIARPLHAALTAKGVSVWFDEAVLEIGDSLRRKIDDGLARCRYGIVILSPRFLDKQWPQRELDGLLARETASGKKAILPVWHELNLETLVRYSPVLADRLAARSEEGVTAVVEKILRAIRA